MISPSRRARPSKSGADSGHARAPISGGFVDVPTVHEREELRNWLLAEGLSPESASEEGVDLFVWRGGDSIAGVAGLEALGPQGVLRAVAVRREWRRRGIAAALVEHIRETARQMGLSELYLLTTTAAEYFAGQGFERIARGDVAGPVLESSEFATLCPDAATVMVRLIEAGRHGDAATER